MKMECLSLIVLIGLILPQGEGRAQVSPSRSLGMGHWSISFRVPSGGGASLGAWKFLSSKTNLGLEITGSLTDWEEDGLSFSETQGEESFTEDRRDWTILVAPTVKQYLAMSRDFAPFLYGSVGAGFSRNRYDDTREPARESRRLYETKRVFFGFGFGIDWTPLSSVSVGGHTGFSVNYYDTENFSGFDDLGGIRASLSSSHRWELRTLTSGLSLHVYF